MSQWRKIEMRGRRRNGRSALHLRIGSFAGNSERQSFVRCTVCVPSYEKKRTSRRRLHRGNVFGAVSKSGSGSELASGSSHLEGLRIEHVDHYFISSYTARKLHRTRTLAG
ncbi:hypothetical protein EVAR_17977_1 [Eumeta japonica]|uniref:Uncharacterized protein n=1 Tax=Eumeta variegata TaxID=151549 RepID=A0A4C1UZP1_EUMVA|nr:hypothetical protein EVAR_17977_1 [Eumeta japonica]